MKVIIGIMFQTIYCGVSNILKYKNMKDIPVFF